jgi:hypothetical protein
MAPSLFDHTGGGAPDVQVSLPAGGGQRPTSATAEVGRITPEQLGEHSAAITLMGRSGAALESAEHRELASDLVGA